MKTKVVIAGAGAVGLFLGGRLIEKGIDVSFLGRKRIREILQHDGLSLSEGTELPQHIPTQKLDYRTDPEIIREAHWIWVTVKSQSTKQLCQDIAPYVRPGAHFLSFQNGIHNGIYLRERFPQHSVQSVVVPFNVVPIGHGYIMQNFPVKVIVENNPAASGKQIETLLTKASIPFQMVDQIYPIMWGKLLLNLNNAINALSGLSIKDELSYKCYRRVLANCLEEALDVYDKAGIVAKTPIRIPIEWVPNLLKMPDKLFNVFSKTILGLDSNSFSSMWQDLKAHKKTEIDYINGEFLRLADQFNVPVPTIRHLYDLVKSCELKQSGSPDLPGDAMIPDMDQAA